MTDGGGGNGSSSSSNNSSISVWIDICLLLQFHFVRNSLLDFLRFICLFIVCEGSVAANAGFL